MTSAAAPTAFFLREGEAFVPTRLSQGPWGSSLSGHVVGGLLGWVIERDGMHTELQPARLTVDLMRPTSMAPVAVRTHLVRDGRRLRIVDAQLVQDGEVVARASGVFLRRGEQSSGQIWSTPVAMPPVPAAHERVSDELPVFIWAYGKDAVAGSPGVGISEWQQAAGPKYAWVRETRPLVDGEQLTPFVHAAMAGDIASSLTHWGTDGLHFINADYTLTLCRPPDGPHIGLASLTHYSAAGVAAGVATVFDEHVPIGSAMATALVNPGFRPPSTSAAELGNSEDTRCHERRAASWSGLGNLCRHLRGCMCWAPESAERLAPEFHPGRRCQH